MNPSRPPDVQPQPSRLAVITPALNAAGEIRAVLSAIFQSDRKPDQVLVYDDGSTDGTGDIAASLGAAVLRNDGAPRGPGAGRNACAQKAEADILVFIDADVVVDTAAIGRLEAAIARSDRIVAAFGSYDDDPPSRSLVARYANLRHHFIHQQSGPEVTTFWAGLGAVRRPDFLAAGGYDETLFSQPSIEDIELGARLTATGARVAVVPDAQGAHLKDWRLLQLWRTDIVQRAIPWAKLLTSQSVLNAELNTSTAERWRALAAWLVLAAFAGALLEPRLIALAAAAVTLYAVLNCAFFAVLMRRGGAALAAAGAGLHWLYHLYASAILAFYMARAMLAPSARRRPAPEAR